LDNPTLAFDVTTEIRTAGYFAEVKGVRNASALKAAYECARSELRIERPNTS
jgi:hypothetical protein